MSEVLDDAAVRKCLFRATDALLAVQDDGVFKGELETNVTIEAEDLLLRQFLGIRTEELTASTAQWIRAQQRADGSWATFFGGPPDLSTTIEAYVALRLAGDDPASAHLVAARRVVLELGGIERARVFTKLWLALFGVWPWAEVPVLVPEIVLLPSWCPLNVYDFACWARQTIVALAVVCAHRPVRELGVDLDELFTHAVPERPRGLRTWEGRFEALDRALQRYERRPLRTLRRLALARAERWILRRQEADGSWGGIQPPWVYSLLALHLQGYALDHPAVATGLAGLDRFTIHDARGRRLEACQSPVWDTALALTALRDAVVGADDAAVRDAASFLVREEVRVAGDWAVRRPGLAPSGWSFEFENDTYPDVDDTAEVLLALARCASGAGSAGSAGGAGGRPAPGLHDADLRGAIARGLDWLEGMQCADGGWAAFDADNTRTLCRSLPFCDFGELIDPPSADVTAHVVEALCRLGRRGARVDRGVRWLLEHQEPDGSWFGRWGANYVYGTGAVLPALVAAGLGAGHPAVRAGLDWLTAHQNPDGGWGEDLRSYRDASWRGRGASTASQTAWALLALLAADERGEPTRRGVGYLVETQGDDGSWEEPWFTGTGFPGDFYLNYHLYRLVFPVSALGRYVHGTSWRD